MPELPEVETIKLQLRKYLIGHRIEKVEIRNPKIFTGDVKNVAGVKVANVRRFAKVLSIDLDNRFSIVVQIKLTGQLIYQGPNLSSKGQLSEKVTGGVPGKHTHVIFYLDRGGVLYYNDVRKFGRIEIAESSKLKTQNKFLGKLGPEPFKDLTLDYFKDVLSKTSRAIKVVLMDQSKIGGVGNIYANDALWLAKINPKRPSLSLSPSEQKELYDAIHKVLKEGLKYGGASELAFVTPDGSEGDYQNHTLVYGRDGEICQRCHRAKVEKFFLGGRGTYYCPACQPAKNS